LPGESERQSDMTKAWEQSLGKPNRSRPLHCQAMGWINARVVGILKHKMIAG